MSTSTTITTTPLLTPTNDDSSIPSSSHQPTSNPSRLVQHSAVQLIQERRRELAYSKPIVIIDLIWNTVLVLVSVVVIILSNDETAKVPLRTWLVVYGVVCVINMVCVYVEYCHRREVRGASGSAVGSSVMSISNSNVGIVAPVPERRHDESHTSVARNLQSASTKVSFIWWIIGFFWVSSSPPMLADDAPKLYWLTIIFLSFDVLFAVTCVVVACIIGIAVCCFLPCIIAVLYTVSDQDELNGATKEAIERLKKYKFRRLGEAEGPSGENQESMCAICQSDYVDDSELHELPCHHHFHCDCIDKWLLLNPTCPNCKRSILTNGNQSSNEV